MRQYYDEETGEEVTVTDSIQVARWNEFDEFGIEHFKPKFSLEGGKFPDDYAIPQAIAESIEMEMGVNPSEHGIKVVDTDKLTRL